MIIGSTLAGSPLQAECSYLTNDLILEQRRVSRKTWRSLGSENIWLNLWTFPLWRYLALVQIIASSERTTDIFFQKICKICLAPATTSIPVFTFTLHSSTSEAIRRFPNSSNIAIFPTEYLKLVSPCREISYPAIGLRWSCYRAVRIMLGNCAREMGTEIKLPQVLSVRKLYSYIHIPSRSSTFISSTQLWYIPT